MTATQPLPARPRPIGRFHWLGFVTLFRRELRRNLKEWLETLAAPAVNTGLYLGIFALALGPGRGGPDGADLLRYIGPGLLLFTVTIRAAEATMFSLVFDRMEGMIADVLMPPLSALEITAAYALAGTVAGLVTGLPALAVTWLIVDLPLADPALAVAFALSAGLMMALIGVMVGLWARRWDHIAAVLGFLLVPITFLSGLFAPVDTLPWPLSVIARANPVFYAIDGMRSAFLGTGTAAPGHGLAVLVALDIGLALLCHRLVARGWHLKA